MLNDYFSSIKVLRCLQCCWLNISAVDHRVMTDVAGEFLELFVARQLAQEQQIGHFHEGALLYEIFDCVSSVVEVAVCGSFRNG